MKRYPPFLCKVHFRSLCLGFFAQIYPETLETHREFAKKCPNQGTQGPTQGTQGPDPGDPGPGPRGPTQGPWVGPGAPDPGHL